MWEFEHPRLSSALGYGLVSIFGLFLIGLGWRSERTGGSPEALYAIGGVALLLGSVLVLAVVWNWHADQDTDRFIRRHMVETRTPFSEALSAASMLTSEQARIVPKLYYQTQVEVVVGAQHELGFVLSTPDGGVPYAWIENFLRQCGVTHLVPVSHYMDGTPGRYFARALTEWLVAHHYAIPHNKTIESRANGPNAAAWVTEQSRDQVKRALRLYELLGYQNAVNDEAEQAEEEEPVGSIVVGPVKTGGMA